MSTKSSETASGWEREKGRERENYHGTYSQGGHPEELDLSSGEPYDRRSLGLSVIPFNYKWQYEGRGGDTGHT